MADIENQEFKFPDENETQQTATPVEDNFEIEIEDDVPPEDRNRTAPDPEKIKQLEVEVDDLDKYSKEAKDKLIKMKRVWNDERRAKEAALREQQAAIEAAQHLIEENKRIKSMLTQGESGYKEAISRAAELEYTAARKAYRQAHESGDTDALLEAQEALNKTQLQLERVKGFRLPALQEERFNVQTQQQIQSVPQPEPRVMRWQQENPWFGQDQEMTAAALGLNEKLRSQGVVVGSEDYYAKLDTTMRKRFNDYFGDDIDPEEIAEPRADKQKAKLITNVAPATRSTAPRKVRLTQSQVAVIKKLGITPEQYVHEFLKVGA